MLLFIDFRRVCGTQNGVIQIHLMLLFIVDGQEVEGVDVEIQIHLMLLFIPTFFRVS